MNKQNISIPIMVIVFFVALSVVFGGQFLLKKYNQELPLIKDLKVQKEVLDAKIDKSQDKVVIQVKLAKVNDLRETYLKLTDMINKSFDPASYRLVLLDKRDQKLDNVYYQSHFSIYEGIQLGDFSAMRDKTMGIFKSAKVDSNASKIIVDNDNVYVQIMDGNNFFYEVIQRGNTTPPDAGPSGLGGDKNA